MSGIKPIIYNVDNEVDLINKTFELIKDTDPDIITGYNTLGFDLDYLYHRCIVLNIPLPESAGRIKGFPTKYYDKSWSSSNANKVDVKLIHMAGRVHLDVYKIAKQLLMLPNYKLNTVAKSLNIGEKVDVSVGEMFDAFRVHQRMRVILQRCTASYDEEGEPVPHNNVSPEVWAHVVSEYYSSTTRLAEIIRYCMVDTELSLKLYDNFKYIQLTREYSNAFEVCINDVFTRGQGHRGRSLLFTMVVNENCVANSVPKENGLTSYEGALNLGTKHGKRGLFDKLGSVDVQGMYPAQIMKHNISSDTKLTEEEAMGKYRGRCEEHCWKNYEGLPNETSHKTWLVDAKVRRGWFPRLLDVLKEKRSAAKKLMEKYSGKPEYETYNARQLALKIVANSVYGLIGSEHSNTSDKVLASLVTAKARGTLLSIESFLINGGPPEEWLKERNADESRPRYYDKFPNATIVYGDTDSVQFNYPQIVWKTNREMVEFYTRITAAINEYLSPIVIELEKIGIMHLEGPKHYAIRLVDQRLYLKPGVPNPKCGEWKSGIKITGLDTVKRIHPSFHKKCLKDLISRILDDNSYYENSKHPDPELACLEDNMDDLIGTLYKVYMQKYPATDYLVYESYTAEGVESNVGVLGRRQAELGRPLNVGERIGYVFVRFLKENSSTKVREKVRILDDFDEGDVLDTLRYVERMQTPYDTTMNTRYSGTAVFSRFWQERLKKMLPIINIDLIKQNPNVSPSALFCRELSSRLTKLGYNTFPVPSNYNELIALRESADYSSRFNQSTRTQVTKIMNKMLFEGGWALALDTPNIVEKFLVAVNKDVLYTFVEALMTPKAYSEIKNM
jgi:DNA polymerase I